MTNSKIIILFKEYKPFQVEKINKNIIITVSNVKKAEEIFSLKDDTKENEKSEEVLSLKDDTKEDEKAEEVLSLKDDTKEDEKAEEVTSFKDSDYQDETTSNNIQSNEKNILSKVKFKLLSNGSKIIIKTKNIVSYQTSLEGKKFTITLNNSVFASRMVSLSLNTEFFKTTIKKIIPKRRGKDIIIKLILSKAMKPTIEQLDNTLELTF